MKKQCKTSAKHCVGHIISTQKMLAIITVISFIGTLGRIKLYSIYGRPGPLVGAQQTLVSFPMRKTGSFSNLLGLWVI